MTNDVRKESTFTWNDKTSRAAVALAEGKTQRQVAEEVDISDRTLRRWLDRPEFAAEVDRLSLMVALASRAYRLRIANRVARQKVKDDKKIETDRDILDWLKYAQSETDGVKLGLTEELLAAVGQNDSPLAGGGSG